MFKNNSDGKVAQSGGGGLIPPKIAMKEQIGIPENLNSICPSKRRAVNKPGGVSLFALKNVPQYCVLKKLGIHKIIKIFISRIQVLFPTT
jgi:hypothetical protein